jgi:hypothetical protein
MARTMLVVIILTLVQFSRCDLGDYKSFCESCAQEGLQCCNVNNIFQCVGSEFACSKIFPFYGCLVKQRCPKLLEKDSQLCFLTPMRYHYCQGECGEKLQIDNTKQKCLDGSYIQSDFVRGDDIMVVNKTKYHMLLFVLFLSFIALYIFRNRPIMRFMHMPLIIVQLLGFTLYTRMSFGMKNTDPCPLKQIIVTGSFMLSGCYIKMALTAYYRQRWKKENKIIQAEKLFLNGQTNVADLAIRTTFYDQFIGGWGISIAVSVFCYLQTLLFLYFYTDIPLSETRSCMSIEHPNLASWTATTALATAVLQCFLVIRYYRTVNFIQSLQVISDIFIRAGAILFHAITFVTFHLILNRAIELVTAEHASNQVVFTIGNAGIALQILFDIIVAVFLPIVYDYLIYSKYSKPDKDVKDKFKKASKGREKSTLMELMIKYSIQEYAADVVIIWRALLRLREEQDTVRNIDFIRQVIDQNGKTVQYYFGENIQVNHLRVNDYLHEAFQYITSHHILPMYARMLKYKEYDLLEKQ